MSDPAATDLVLVHRVAQFYYREARLLDERAFRQWLELLDPEIEFLMPSRHVPMPDRQMREETSLSIDRELERRGPAASPLRLERYQTLAYRVARAYRPNAWTETPPPRTRRLIANVEAEPLGDGRLRTFSNFHLFYSHNAAENHHYVGGRRDVLRDEGDGFRIVNREVILDWNVVTAPSLSLFF